MLSKRVTFFWTLLTCAITVSSVEKVSCNNIECRKEIYNKYVSFHKYEGEWKDPYHTLSDLKFIDTTDLTNILKINNMNEVHNSYISCINLFLFIVPVFVGCFLFCYPKTVVFMIIFIITVFWHWMKMYQEKIAEKHNLMENLRHENECRRSELSWYESVSLYFGSYVSQETDCEKYYKAVLVDPFWEVSFPVVIANAVTSVICEPLKVIATTLRICAKELFSGLTLAQLCIIFFIIFIFILIWKKYSLSFGWGFISIQPTSYSSGNECGSKSTSYLQLFKKSILGMLFSNNQLSKRNLNSPMSEIEISLKDELKSQQDSILCNNDFKQDKGKSITFDSFENDVLNNSGSCKLLNVKDKFHKNLKDSLPNNFYPNKCKNIKISRISMRKNKFWKTSLSPINMEFVKLYKLMKKKDSEKKLVSCKLSQEF